MGDIVETDDFDVDDFMYMIEELIEILNAGGSELIEYNEEYQTAYLRACRMVGITPTLIEEDDVEEDVLYED